MPARRGIATLARIPKITITKISSIIVKPFFIFYPFYVNLKKVYVNFKKGILELRILEFPSKIKLNILAYDLDCVGC